MPGSAEGRVYEVGQGHRTAQVAAQVGHGRTCMDQRRDFEASQGQVGSGASGMQARLARPPLWGHRAVYRLERVRYGRRVTVHASMPGPPFCVHATMNTAPGLASDLLYTVCTNVCLPYSLFGPRAPLCLALGTAHHHQQGAKGDLNILPPNIPACRPWPGCPTRKASSSRPIKRFLAQRHVFRCGTPALEAKRRVQVRA